jgi:organic radical activating enzyme
MHKIKVSEIFGNTYQGEGRYVGVSSIFLRTFGCNFRCKDFGLTTPTIGKYNAEVAEVIKKIDQFKVLEDLPLVKTGCDTYAAIYPEFKHLSPLVEVSELADQLTKLCPQNEGWYQSNGNYIHLVITGGEPLLGWQEAYPDLLKILEYRGLQNVTFETNGTKWITKELANFIDNSNIEFTFSVSPKLSASGEKWSDAIKPAIVSSYEQYGFTYLKFVVDNHEHVNEVDKAVHEYRLNTFMGPVYIMPVGGVTNVYESNEFNVATEALNRGYHFSPRLHLTLFGNKWGK